MRHDLLVKEISLILIVMSVLDRGLPGGIATRRGVCHM